ncbi:flagellar basal body P-ring formation protein FlgA [Vibrio cincinnatiensis]|nr:flagellar basal body P-ring formation protein FlgA [Vibrio cincinnatiensis]
MRWTFIFLSLYSSLTLAMEVKLSFREPVLRVSDQTKLKDILTIRTRDESLHQNIGGLPWIWIGSGKELSSDSVVRYIETQVKNELDVQWRGEKRAVVKWQVLLDADSVLATIKKEVEPWGIEAFGTLASVHWHQTLEPIYVEDKNAQLEFELDSRLSNPSLIVGVLKVKIDMILSAKMLLRIPISVEKPVYVATCSLADGAILDHNCFSIQKRVIDHHAFVDTELNLSSLRLISNLEPGSVLQRNNVKPISLVEAGDKVLAVYTGKGVMIDSYGVAKQAGNEGDMIRVLISSIGTELPAKVTRTGSVEINGN